MTKHESIFSLGAAHSGLRRTGAEAVCSSAPDYDEVYACWTVRGQEEECGMVYLP